MDESRNGEARGRKFEGRIVDIDPNLIYINPISNYIGPISKYINPNFLAEIYLPKLPKKRFGPISQASFSQYVTT